MSNSIHLTRKELSVLIQIAAEQNPDRWTTPTHSAIYKAKAAIARWEETGDTKINITIEGYR